MTSKIVPVIMAGGKGTRLWPLSRATAPKQFIRFLGPTTLYRPTHRGPTVTALVSKGPPAPRRRLA